MTVTTNAASLAQTFRNYAEVYGSRHPDVGPAKMLIENARKLATDLYNVSAEIAPTQAQIAADVKKLGWKIPKKFPDGRIGRGEPSDWQGLAFSDVEKSLTKGRKGRRSNKLKGQLQAAETSIRGTRPTLEMMQNYVIRRRFAHIKYIASGWLGAIQDLGGSLKQSSGNVKSSRGRAEVQDDAIVIINNSAGINVVNQKYKLVQRAIQRRISDLRVYLLDHLSPAAIKRAA